MERQHIIGLGAFAVLVGAVALASPHAAKNTADLAPVTSTAHLKLASLSISARHDVDYSALDERLKAMVAKPSMVGLAVGVIENGRITFLAGYGETAHGSGEAVTPATVFR